MLPLINNTPTLNQQRSNNMPLLLAALTPHSPVLLPAIGREHTQSCTETLQSLEHLATRIAESAPDTILIVAADDESRKRQARLHMAPSYTATFERFGDLVTKLDFASDPVLTDRIKNEMREYGYPMLYDTSEKMSYEASVPLSYLMKGLTAKVVVLNPGHGTLKKQFEIGKELQKTLQESEKRIICIASGDLAHALPQQGDEHDAACVAFDKDIVTFLKTEKTKKILSTPVHMIREFGACGLPAFATILGMTDHMNTSCEVLSYERPLGVGFLVAEFSF